MYGNWINYVANVSNEFTGCSFVSNAKRKQSFVKSAKYRSVNEERKKHVVRFENSTYESKRDI